MKRYFDIIMKPEFLYLSIVGAIILYFIIFALLTKTDYSKYKANRQDKNKISMAFLLYVCVYWIPVFVDWLNSYSDLNIVFNLLFVFISTFLYSSLLSIVDFFINCSNPNSHIKHQERHREIKSISENIQKQNLHKLNNTKKALDKVFNKPRPLFFNFKYYNKTNKQIPDRKDVGVYTYSISKTNIELNVELKLLATRAGSYIEPNNYFSINNIKYGFKSQFKDKEDFNPSEPNFNEKDIFEHLQFIYDKSLKEKEFELSLKKEDAVIPLGDFLFNNTILLLSIGNPILFPNSNSSKLVRILLGLIKYFVLGIIIMLFMK